MAQVKNKTFDNQPVKLDDTDFQECSFRACSLVYAGGNLPAFFDCTFEACGWHFEDAAGRTVMLIRAMAQAMGELEGRHFVDNLFTDVPSALRASPK